MLIQYTTTTGKTITVGATLEDGYYHYDDAYGIPIMVHHTKVTVVTHCGRRSPANCKACSTHGCHLRTVEAD